ncbi:DEAD/DEAH box helicase [Solicola gregarius]|uniref:DEAD/DEAH box helicase n=1 Tax=Solicola gregarius TaxID=2908642 RepID=A0AA46YJU8_9ACTN|nr:DEAD/DEAH box helicase [Solicola gregarius]UYM03373.1 DEAD/DEAH box helicase [Solicola gregarius]
MTTDPSALLRHALAGSRREDRLLHVERVPERTPVYAEWPPTVPDDIRAAYRAIGIDQLWAHQVDAIQQILDGHGVVVSTGTASGKSAVYQVPALSALTAGRQGSVLRDRSPTVLYVAPTKALAHDQLRGLAELIGEQPSDRRLDGVRAAAVDGDNSREERAWARDHANYVVTNPDLLHRTLLPGHARWSRFIAGLRYVVIDECHHYRGVFGSHVAHIVRRLRRLAAHYGAHPVFVLTSATVAEPEALALALTGVPATAITDDTSPRGEAAIALWEPPLLDAGGEHEAPVRRSAIAESADVLTDLVVADIRTLAFVRSRRGAEALAMSAQRLLHEVEPTLSRRVTTYRGGYLPEERREIERLLRDGELLGLASTSALELGVDISGLDAVVTVGFPGTRAALFQQFGRAGRGTNASLGVLVARDDPLDAYLVRHPDKLLGAPVEATVLDPSNPHVLGPHLAAAAQELPLTDDDMELFGPGSAEGADALLAAGWLRRRPRGLFWTRRERAADLADIRSSGGPAVHVVDGATGRVLGTADSSSAHATVHTGAVYVHRGETYVVDEFDHEDGVAVVHRDEPDYTTTARDVTEIAIVEPELVSSWGRTQLAYGSVDVSQQVVSYLRRRIGSGEVLAEEPLDLPVRTLRTKGVWWMVPDDAVDPALSAADIPGAAHAAEHASIGLLPLLASCDRWDIGGVSTALHPDTGMLTVFVYDGHPGGAGFASRAYERAAEWLQTTRDAIAGCECADGCPSCVQSPKCGNGNQPLDKAGAVRLLDVVLADVHESGSTT